MARFPFALSSKDPYFLRFKAQCEAGELYKPSELAVASASEDSETPAIIDYLLLPGKPGSMNKKAARDLKALLRPESERPKGKKSKKAKGKKKGKKKGGPADAKEDKKKPSKQGGRNRKKRNQGGGEGANPSSKPQGGDRPKSAKNKNRNRKYVLLF